MLRLHLLVLCTLFCFIAISQTQINGVVNRYYKVTNVTNEGQSIVVDDATGLKKGDKVMIIQMKGASVITNNSPSYGTPTLKNAGNYELNIICNVAGNMVYLANTLASTYDVDDKVQLVYIPQYANAVVTQPLTALLWDSTTGKGGVLAISVKQILTLNAPVIADGAGYKGGRFILDNSTNCYFFQNEYYYDPIVNPQYGAYKGESVADAILLHQGGKGAVANGGGGGNTHNNGGGGGGNLSAGGNGGGNSSSGGCIGPKPGIGGYGLSNNNNQKIFLGGGGGAGHGNNNLQAGGGNGGGIILIEAATLTSNAQQIRANGIQGSSTVGDGASGGGAGGTIILNVTTYTDQPIIQAKGGNGGIEDDIENESGRCFGAGGGGSGGAVFFKAASVSSSNVSGGLRGERINTQCPTSYLAFPGAAGRVITNYTPNQSTIATDLCPDPIILPVKLVYFKATLVNNKTVTEWKVTGAEDAKNYTVQRMQGNQQWQDAGLVTADAQKDTYSFTDLNTVTGNTFYRLKITELNGAVHYSSIQLIQLKNGAGTLAIYPNPASGIIAINYALKKGDVVKIMDVSGKVVFQKTISTNTNSLNQNIAFLQKGVYVVQAAGKTATLVVQ